MPQRGSLPAANGGSRMTSTAADIASMYTSYYAKIYAFIRLRVQTYGTTNENVEDMAQETFRRALESLQSGTEVEQPLAWLYRIAKNITIDHFRFNGRRQPSIVWDDVRDEPANDLSPADYAMSAIACDTILGCVGRLTDGQAKAVGLMADGYQSCDLGDMLGLSDSGGKQLLMRGRRSLRGLLSARGYA